jgi:hypothetical protein
MLKVKFKLEHEEICYIYRILFRINEHAVKVLNKTVTQEITFAAADELAPLFARKLIRKSKKPRAFTLSRLHAIMLKTILRYFGKHGQVIDKYQAVDEVMAMLILSKLGPKT